MRGIKYPAACHILQKGDYVDICSYLITECRSISQRKGKCSKFKRGKVEALGNDPNKLKLQSRRNQEGNPYCRSFQSFVVRSDAEEIATKIFVNINFLVICVGVKLDLAHSGKHRDCVLEQAC